MVVASFAFAGNAFAHEDDYKPPPECGGGKPACDPYGSEDPNPIPGRFLVQRINIYQAVIVPFAATNPCVPGDGDITGTAFLETWNRTELYSDGDTKTFSRGHLSTFSARATMRDFLPSLNGAFYRAVSDSRLKEFDNAQTPGAPDSFRQDAVFILNRKCDEFPGDDFRSTFRFGTRIDQNGMTVVDPAPTLEFNCV